MAESPFVLRNKTPQHVVIEVFGGDNDLSKFVYNDLAEMALGNWDDKVGVLVLLDLQEKGACVKEYVPGERFCQVEDWGEIDTGDPRTIALFLGRALKSFPAETRKAIGFWDHGTGVFYEKDPDEIILTRSARSSSSTARRLFANALKSKMPMRAMLHDNSSGGLLTTREAYGVLTTAWKIADLHQKIDLIFSDACLNGMIEVLYQFSEFAEVVVGSQEEEPGDGWEYEYWFSLCNSNPPDTPQKWAAHAVEGFRRGYDKRTKVHPCTLSAFKTDSELPGAVSAVAEAILTGGEARLMEAERAQRNAQSFCLQSSIDLGHFLSNLRLLSADRALQHRIDEVLRVYDAARVANVKLGKDVVDATGLSIWFPTSKRAFASDKDTYQYLRFAENTRWLELISTIFSEARLGGRTDCANPS